MAFTKSIFMLGAMCVVAATHATVLTFDITGATDGSLMPQGYGDNVTSTTMGTYSYGMGSGFTPNVVASYHGKGNQQDLNFWTTGYNNLNNVVEYEPDGDPGYSVTLTADAGFNVYLESFDLGNYGGAISIPKITIFGDGNVVLFQSLNYALGGSSGPYSTFNFSTPLQGKSLTIDFDLTGLGGASDNVGMDNISFNQGAAPVPEPATLTLLGIGVAAMLRKRKKSA